MCDRVFLHKSLKECSLREVVDGLTTILRITHMFDTVDYEDKGNYYLLILAHSLGLNNSKLNLTILENVFKTYNVKLESTISEKTIFMKVFKDK